MSGRRLGGDGNALRSDGHTQGGPVLICPMGTGRRGDGKFNRGVEFFQTQTDDTPHPPGLFVHGHRLVFVKGQELIPRLHLRVANTDNDRTQPRTVCDPEFHKGPGVALVLPERVVERESP